MTKPKAQQEAEAAASKRGRGRPRTITEVHVKTVRAMAARGWTEIEMADALGISIMTFRRWKVDFPDFLLASTPTAEEQVAAVKAALLSRALGYSHASEKILVVSQGKGMPSEVQRHSCVEHYPPDVAAIRYFLNNKSAGEYKDTQEVEQRGDVTVRVEGGLPEKEEGDGTK